MLFGRFIRSWCEYSRFKSLSEKDRSIVFYSEGAGYSIYLWPVMKCLLEDHGRRLCYVTNDASDPLLSEEIPGLSAFYMESASTLIAFFNNLEAGILIMTMPDLETFHLKRSKHPVYYAYLHHSIVSTHMVYRTGAFDHFDGILCAGPHHETETRAWEAAHGLKPKELFPHGYAPLDTIMEEGLRRGPLQEDRTRVLVAPSWGSKGVLELYGEQLVDSLLRAGFEVYLRPHPNSRKTNPDAIDRIRQKFDGLERYHHEEDIRSHDSFYNSHVMVSDWSGAAMEFAFGLERPVLFIDVPRKVNNPDYESIDCLPLEERLREEIGLVLAVEDIEQAGGRIEELRAAADTYREKICAAREAWVYNVGHSGEVGARIVAELSDRIQGKR